VLPVRLTLLILLLAAAAGCRHAGTGGYVGTGAPTPPTAVPVEPDATASSSTTTATVRAATSPVHVAEGSIVSVVLVGDVMLGRGVAPIVRSEPAGIFEEVRHVIAGADIAAANLESPLTLRPHTGGSPFELEADPGAAGSLNTAGFDLVAIANNHAGDAGRLSVLDTIEAVNGAGVATVGGGEDMAAAYAVQVFERNGLRVGFLAFDATLAGTKATPGYPGIASWDEGMVRAAVASARPQVDLLIVGVHGGVEYYAETDPGMEVLAGRLAGWGVDVVWGHGPHVVQPVFETPGVGGRTTLVATSLGNFLFDQSAAGTRRGAVLEVLADSQGIFAYRIGTTEHHDLRVHFETWMPPETDAVLLGLDWWNLTRWGDLAPERSAGLSEADFAGGDVAYAVTGDATGDGRDDLVIAHRRPYRENGITAQFPEREWADGLGRSAHLGVYRPDDLREVWVAGSLFRPIARVAVCDGALALAFNSLDHPAVVATSGWVWQGFGFAVSAELNGGGTPGCIDVDGDGKLDPVIVDRPHRTG
jgi:poly-gamma-glutamate synthesis protein (capsule biosynthesis protein)